jgi:hypothetical protein
MEKKLQKVEEQPKQLSKQNLEREFIEIFRIACSVLNVIVMSTE